jgi:hypothetical protein
VSACFADAWFYLALLDERDSDHSRVVAYAAEYNGQMITTRWVLGSEMTGDFFIGVPHLNWFNKYATISR